jgi:hypothetical protein
MTIWQTFWSIFVRSPTAVPLWWPPPLPSTQFYCYYRPPEGGRSPARLWSAVWHGASLNTTRFPVPGCGESRGCGFAVGPGLLLFLSGPLALQRSGQVSETGRLYSAVTHHTCNTLHVPESLYLDLASLLLLVRKWGPTLPHLVSEAPHGIRFV